MPLRIATYNIEHGRGSDGLFDAGRLANALALLDTDVLGLQEVDVNVAASQRSDQARLAADATGMQVAFGPVARVGWTGRYGNALLARGRIDDVDVVELPRGQGRDRRSALLAAVDIAGRRVSVAVTHLSVRHGHARPQLEAVHVALLHRPLPRVLLADCNMAAAAVAPVVAEAGMELVLGPPTFPALAPRAQIDHVAVADLSVRSVSVPAADVSDHRPLVVDVD
jgi:endonuclease/exonuclease/phosphatase family metal-dependent hydrolase